MAEAARVPLLPQVPSDDREEGVSTSSLVAVPSRSLGNPPCEDGITADLLGVDAESGEDVPPDLPGERAGSDDVVNSFHLLMQR